MAWIKRNLFFVIGSAVALLLLGAAGFYSFQNWSDNQAALDKLNETYNTLRDLNNQKPSPGNEKVDNIKIAREQEQQLRTWLTDANQYFQPIPSVPPPAENGVVGGEAFAAALHRTIDQLQHDAEAASVMLPPRYSFSFEAERPLVRFAPGSPAPLAQELGEVKVIAGILFSAKVNSLDNIQRVRVSDDDNAGPQMDYLAEASVTNDLAVITPYIVTFRSFSHELAQVISGFASSPNAFIVKAIDIDPASGVIAASPDGTTQPPGASPISQPVAGRGGLQTVLNEQLLRITLRVEIVKLLPKK